MQESRVLPIALCPLGALARHGFACPRWVLILLTLFPMTSMSAEKQTVKIGDLAPDFTLQSLDGREIRLSDYRGKRVLLFTWASW